MLACSLTFLSVLPQSTHAMYQFFSRFVKLSFRALAMMSATTTTHGKGIMRGYHVNVSCSIKGIMRRKGIICIMTMYHALATMSAAMTTWTMSFAHCAHLCRNPFLMDSSYFNIAARTPKLSGRVHLDNHVVSLCDLNHISKA